jgi:hypothetical protein
MWKGKGQSVLRHSHAKRSLLRHLLSTNPRMWIDTTSENTARWISGHESWVDKSDLIFNMGDRANLSAVIVYTYTFVCLKVRHVSHST